MESLYTLIIPTSNRPEYLLRHLSFLERNYFKYLVIVADSSIDEIKKINQNNIELLNLDIKYIEYNQDALYPQKWLDSLNYVSSKYCSFCADDDIIIPESVNECVNFLQKNPEFSGCQGISLNFIEEDSNIHINRIEYSLPSIINDDPLVRLTYSLTHYEANIYGVYRRNTLQNAFIKSKNITSLLFSELFICSSLVLSGKIQRLNIVSCLRNSSIPTNHIHSEPSPWIKHDSKNFMSEYMFFHQKLINFVNEEVEKIYRDNTDLKIHGAFFNYLSNYIKNIFINDDVLLKNYKQHKRDSLILILSFRKRVIRYAFRIIKNKIFMIDKERTEVAKNSSSVDRRIKNIIGASSFEKFERELVNYFGKLNKVLYKNFLD